MVCKLCLEEKDSLKTNTHFLTDSIIRRVLNEDGVDDTHKGLMFDISNNSIGIKFNFQRGILEDKLTKELGRKPTDNEIEEAREKVAFSVNDTFCDVCEERFGMIESKVVPVLKEYRKQKVDSKFKVKLDNPDAIRMFCLLQIWRTSVCTEVLDLDKDTQENLRKGILAFCDGAEIYLDEYPLGLTFYKTEGERKNYTRAIVGATSDKNPYILLLGDFIIQFYTSKQDIAFNSFHGLNDADYQEYLNEKEESFTMLLRTFEDKEKFVSAFLKAEAVDYRIKSLNLLYDRLCEMSGVKEMFLPFKEEFMNRFGSRENDTALKYSEEEIVQFIFMFFKEKEKLLGLI